MLVLSTYKTSNKPMTVDLNGKNLIFVSNWILFFILRKCWRRFDFWIWWRCRCPCRLWSYFDGSNVVFWWWVFFFSVSTSINRLYQHDFNYSIQVSKIEGCKLVRQGDLSFEFRYGSCNTFLEPTPRILLCFSWYGNGTPWKVCHT